MKRRMTQIEALRLLRKRSSLREQVHGSPKGSRGYDRNKEKRNWKEDR